MIEPSLLPAFSILGGSERRKRDCLPKILTLLCFGDEFEPGAIRQTDITQQHVEPEMIQKGERITYTTGRRNIVAAVIEELRQDDARVLMIFNEQDMHG